MTRISVVVVPPVFTSARSRWCTIAFPLAQIYSSERNAWARRASLFEERYLPWIRHALIGASLIKDLVCASLLRQRRPRPPNCCMPCLSDYCVAAAQANVVIGYVGVFPELQSGRKIDVLVRSRLRSSVLCSCCRPHC